MRISLVERERQPQRRHKRQSLSRRIERFDAAISREWDRPSLPPRAERRVSRRREAQPEQRPADSLYGTTRRIAAAILQWFTPVRWVLALALVALLAIIGFASVDRMFFIYDSTIVGARHLDPSVIYETAGIHEQNIFWLQPQTVARKLMGLPGVRAVRVRCGLPADVTIEVAEREPVVLWRATVQGRDWWLDKEGVVLPYHGDPSSPSTIFVVDYSDRHLEEGVLVEPAGLIDSVLQLAAAMPQARLFFFSADRGLSYRQQASSREWMVYVGTSDSLGRKIQAVDVITDYLTASGISPAYIDVRWPDRPVYGMSGG